MAQDSSSTEKVDTVRVGGMIIIKKHSNNEDHEKSHTDVEVVRHHRESNLSTNWCIVDLGFSNWNDKTNYAAAQASGFLGQGMGKDQLGLRSKADSLPARLSGGEQQRVAIARALVNEPALLLADEPTGNLDASLTDSILELLFDANARGTTVVVATHDRALLSRYRRRTVSLDRGKVVSDA